MDMTRYSTSALPTLGEYKLRKHCKAIRENQVSVAYMLLALNGYDFDVYYTGHPLAEYARECLRELESEPQTGIYSCSPTAGGIWTTPQRKMLFTGEV